MDLPRTWLNRWTWAWYIDIFFFLKLISRINQKWAFSKMMIGHIIKPNSRWQLRFLLKISYPDRWVHQNEVVHEFWRRQCPYVYRQYISMCWVYEDGRREMPPSIKTLYYPLSLIDPLLSTFSTGSYLSKHT